MGQSSHRLRGLGQGMLKGLLWGGAIGAVLLALTYEPVVCDPNRVYILGCSPGGGRGDAIAGRTVVFGTLGTLVGGIIGAARGGEHWQHVPSGSAAGIRIAPTSARGVALPLEHDFETAHPFRLPPLDLAVL
ncbi:MAG: hypothetical protein NVS4B3_24580 [Gemmatimonadaceae bacterium]